MYILIPEPELKHIFSCKQGQVNRDLDTIRTKGRQAFLENLVYHQLKYENHKVFIGKHHEREIDFVAQKDGSTRYIKAGTAINHDGVVIFHPVIEHEPARFRGKALVGYLLVPDELLFLCFCSGHIVRIAVF